MSKRKITPSALAPAELLRLLTAAGAEGLTAAAIAADIADGAPINEDGTVNLLHYAAWLIREMRH